MKKKFGIMGIALVLALMASLCFGSVALAAEPTEVKVDWGDGTGGPGSGWIGTTVTAGDDAVISFDTFGSAIGGSFILTDYNDGVTVDNISSYIQAGVANGYIEYRNERTDTDTTNCPCTGQVSYSFILALDGSAEMATGSVCNAARIVDDNGGQPLTSGGHNFEADADSYLIIRSMLGGDGDFVQVTAEGSGTATMDCDVSKAGGYRSPTYLGEVFMAYSADRQWVNGPYDSPFNADGDGTFTLSARGSNLAKIINTSMTSGGACHVSSDFFGANGITIDGPKVTAYGDGDLGSTSVQIIANFTGNFDMPCYAVAAY